jgi:sec-independent protein translocase protein TatA
MEPLIFNLGPTELLIILAIVLLLFGGSRLAGLGKSTGRALKEFKEETKGLKGSEQQNPGLGSSTTNPYAAGTDTPYPPQQGQTPYQQGQTPYQDGPAQPYQQGPTQPSADGTPYQQPPQSGRSNPTDRDVRRDV